MNELVLHIMDIVYNSIAADATLVTIDIEYLTNGYLRITVLDNGNGIEKSQLLEVKSPFKTSRTTRKVGLGISLLELSANQADGELVLESEFGKFTKVTATMDTNHIDCLPMGDLGECIYLLTVASDRCEIVMHYQYLGEQFTYDSREIKEIVGDDLKSNYEIITWIKNYINENILKMEV